MKNLGIGFLACLFFAAADNTSAVSKPQPYGLYYLLQTPNNGADAMADVNSNLTNPNVDGFRLRVTWKDIQPTNASTYDWSIIDNIRALVAPAGKKLGISVSAGIVCPDWVYTPTSLPTVYKYTLDPSTGTVNDDVAGPPPYSLPFPWDTNFQTKWQTFVNAFGAKYDNDQTVTYIVTTGYMQLATLNFIQNSDASQTFHDGVTTNLGVNFTSLTANFTTSDVGKVVSGNSAFRPMTKILTRTDARRVVLDKAMLSSGTMQDFVIEARLAGQGDDYKVNNLAKQHPNGAAGAWPNYSDLAPPPYPPNRYGYASNAAFLDGAKKIVDMFFAAFPRTSLLISPQSPFPQTNPYTLDTNLTIRDYVTGHSPLYHGGTDYTNLQAIVPPYPPRTEGPNPNVKQCIHGSSHTDQLYSPPVPDPIPEPPQPLMDLMESAYSKGAKAMEMYKEDMEADNSDGRLNVLTAERLKFLP